MFQTQMYPALMALVEKYKSFYFSDRELDGINYRIFNYRIASYTEFLEPYALECRGHMFEMSSDYSKAIRLASLPMEKFFNLGENPMTIDVDLDQVFSVMDKLDGSLISTFSHNSSCRFKSKGSLESDQAIAATEFMNRAENANYLRQCNAWVQRNYTINFEWCAPFNRHVIGYPTHSLKIIAIRNNVSGEYVSKAELAYFALEYVDMMDNWVDFIPGDPKQLIKDATEATGIEGYVLVMNNGQRIKVKTPWYISLHRVKDNINSPKQLFVAVIDGGTDDMKSLFCEEPGIVEIIEKAELHISAIYNDLVDKVTKFYEVNKHLDKRSFAILCQKELPSNGVFHLALALYLNREPEFRAHMLQWYSEYKVPE